MRQAKDHKGGIQIIALTKKKYGSATRFLRGSPKSPYLQERDPSHIQDKHIHVYLYLKQKRGQKCQQFC